MVTTSFDVFAALYDDTPPTLVVAGGRWAPSTRVFMGPQGVQTLRQHRADVALLGACALHPRLGLTPIEAEDAPLKQAMIEEAAARRILLTDAVPMSTAGAASPLRRDPDSGPPVPTSMHPSPARPARRWHAAPSLLALTLAACVSAGAAAEPTPAQRAAAARQTAERNPACRAIRPFYWAIGDAQGVQADDRVGLGAPQAQTEMAIASASKLVYATYVLERRGGVPTDEDVAFLNFTSGYTEFDRCLRDQTVAECQRYHGRRIDNGGHVTAHDGRYFYSGGHMQQHAVRMGLGPDDNAALAAHVNAALGGTALRYLQPQPAGGIQTSAAEYGRLLQRIVGGQLKMRDALGSHAVCTNPATCPTAVHAPIPPDESWHYALGHWVEDDPRRGDGAFSSPGAFGFYPWIDADKRWWGVLARQSWRGVGATDPHRHPGAMSVYCGREIRAAWRDGQPR